MKNTLVFVLLFAMLLPMVSPWGTIAYYQVNKDYIARVLCENRNKPELHCDGKCYLAKKLKAQQDKHDQETARHLRGLPTIHLFCSAVWAFSFLPRVSDLSIRPLALYLLIGYKTALTSIFQPPRLL